MRNGIRHALLIVLVLTLGSDPLRAWGFVAHRIVAENAAAGMPGPMAALYRSGSRRISDASLEPDTILRKRDGEVEKRRHFIDLEDLRRGKKRDKAAATPLEIPADLASARGLYGTETLEKAGYLPWRIGEVHDELVSAFRQADWAGVLTLSGWLSHYVADACQPLHTTRNHDGQRTGNHGIHAAFETDMIDISRKRYRAVTQLQRGFTPEVIADPAGRMIQEILEAHELVDDILRADRNAMKRVRRSRADYWPELEERAGGVAAGQLALAAQLTASLWHSAWVEAGRPSLPDKAPRVAKTKGD